MKKHIRAIKISIVNFLFSQNWKFVETLQVILKVDSRM